jgi:hypothetical protein
VPSTQRRRKALSNPPGVGVVGIAGAGMFGWLV